ncbi:MAG: hypothetical protein OXF25_08105 [Cyanobacteria bacterium MAG CAR3_bin_5]|nr:hypothetical protein [Cyanobacteria bacterium MAG CAR4_bin_6]MCY4174010.1 hypothetical protein [Cyanobacteria bacterium MAG CAR3_bin_5]MCY4331575.1 hypothetical protein [Cyanobacteria bacterium MAG CAR1_bin_15]
MAFGRDVQKGGQACEPSKLLLVEGAVLRCLNTGQVSLAKAPQGGIPP